jgi:UPF0148 protein
MNETDEMVKLLLTKAKMLSYHCPRCKLPLFEKDKKVVCVKCGEIIVEKEEKKTLKKQKTEGKRTIGVLKKKRKDLLNQLESEKDPDKIVALVAAISKIEETQQNLEK